MFRLRINAALALTVCSTVLVPRAARADDVIQNARSVIVSGHPEATRLGNEVLKRGGNAVDAFVTTSLALGVAEPGNSGLGGKLVVLYYDAKTKEVSCVVAMDAAALKLPPPAELAAIKSADRKRGWDSACVPGLPAGLAAIHEKWGTKPWKSLVEPVVQLADRGFNVSPLCAEMLSEFPKDVDPESARIYSPGGEKIAAGSTFRNPDLAKTLKALADRGPSAIYSGEIAEKVLAASQANGGYFTADDFANYKPRFLKPLHGSYHGYTVYTSPPPLVGGATVLAAMGALSETAWPNLGDPLGRGKSALAPIEARDARYIDTVGRILQQIYPEVAKSAADVPDSLERVTKIFAADNLKEFAKKALAADVRKGAESRASLAPSALDSLAMSDDATMDDTDEASTTHLLVIDKAGNIVCATQSLGNHFGSGVIAPGTGFLLNNDMNNFAYANPTSVNYVAPGKWPRSTIAPTIVVNEKTGKPYLVVGAPGGQRIPTGVLQVTLDVLDFHRPLEEAINGPRFHVRRATTAKENNNEVDLDKSFDASVENKLKEMGWNVTRRDKGEFYFGAVNAAIILPDGRILGVADQRRTSDAGGS